jgi:hypothetical protein
MTNVLIKRDYKVMQRVDPIRAQEEDNQGEGSEKESTLPTP